MKGNFNITKRESKKMIWCWKLTYVNTWQMPPFIGQKVELLIGGHPLILWLVLDIIVGWFLMLLAGFVVGFWYCWLVLLLVFDIVGWILMLLAAQNVIANIRIRAFCSIKAVGNCLSFPTKKTRPHLDF